MHSSFVPRGDEGHIRLAFGIKEKLLSVDVQHMGQESHHICLCKAMLHTVTGQVINCWQPRHRTGPEAQECPSAGV